MRASALVGDLVHHLRSRILAGEFAADGRVSESGIAAEYNVARPTARSALDILVFDGLLDRNAYSALRVPTIASEDIGEILAILEFSERRALDRLIDTGADIRGVRDAADASIHQLLDALVQSAESARLARIHRRCTFELLLGLQQAGRSEAEVSVKTREAMSKLAETLFQRDRSAARAVLEQVIEERRSVSAMADSGSSKPDGVTHR